MKRRFPDAGEAGANLHADQAGAVSKRCVSDAGNAVGNHHAGQAGAVPKRRVPDAGDWISFNTAGYGDSTTWTDILCYGYLIIVDAVLIVGGECRGNNGKRKDQGKGCFPAGDVSGSRLACGGKPHIQPR